MKILQIGKFWPPHYGGIETSVEILSRGLARSGHSVQVLVSAEISGTSLVEPGLSVHKVKSWGRLFSQPLSLLPSLGQGQFQPDVAHLHLPNPLWAQQIKSSSVPLILTLHADLSENLIKNKLNSLAQTSVLEKAQHLIFTSDKNQNRITKQWSPQQKEKWLPKCQVICPAAAAPALGPLTDENFILFVGRWVGYKGLQLLLKACQGSGLSLVIAGGGPEKAFLEKQIRQLKMQNQCRLVHNPDSEELDRLYRSCSLVVLPSTDEREAFGLTLVEANLRKKPFVASSLNSGIQDILQGRGGVGFEPGNWTDLQAQLQTLMKDPALREQMGARGFEYCLQRFSQDRLIQEHEKLYLRV